MREYIANLDGIFTGLVADRAYRKTKPGLEVCHNLEPLEEDYDLHEAVVDLNADGYDWKTPEKYKGDNWVTHDEDSWADHEEDYGDYWVAHDEDSLEDSEGDSFAGEEELDIDEFENY